MFQVSSLFCLQELLLSSTFLGYKLPPAQHNPSAECLVSHIFGKLGIPFLY